jgi:DNA mismatch endonuclease (patch repair protein)
MQARNGDLLLSPSDVNNFLACEHRTALDLLRARGELELRRIPRPDAELIAERGRQHEAAFLERLRAEGRDIAEIEGEDAPEATVAAMRAGRATLNALTVRLGRCHAARVWSGVVRGHDPTGSFGRSRRRRRSRPMGRSRNERTRPVPSIGPRSTFPTMAKRPPRPIASSDGVSRRMSTLGRRDTEPELLLRRELHRRGLRYRTDCRPLATVRTRADIVFPRARVAVYVDGCFWHACPEHGTMPRANREFWGDKLARNRQRDEETDDLLVENGWISIRVWEHEDPLSAADRVEAVIRGRLPERQ